MKLWLIPLLSFCTLSAFSPSLDSSKNNLEWEPSLSFLGGNHYSKEYEFVKDGITYELFSFERDEKKVGYVVLNGSQIALIYKGDVVPNKEEISKIPLIGSTSSNSGIQRVLQSAEKTAIASSNRFANYQYIKTPSSLVDTEVYSQSFSPILQNVPEYYSEVITDGCAPTAGAMLLSFYDRYSSYTSLYSGFLPLKHDDDQQAVDDFIKTVAAYMKTNLSGRGTTRANERSGLQAYLNNHSCTGHSVNVGNSFSDYVSYYTYSNNPAFISISRHAILGIGYASIRQYYSDGSQGISQFMVTHYDWRSRAGDYYVPANQLEQFLYIKR